MKAVPRLLLSATSSDSGKTTMMLALLAAYRQRHLRVQSYKSGPDYIDPMFHTRVTGRPVYHTDPFFLQQDALQQLVTQTATDADLALIEGAMGFYDGIGQTSEASAYTVAEWLQAPTVLVVNPQKMGRSVAAICKGFLQLEEKHQIKGFLLNRVRTGMVSYYKEIIERETGLPVYGYLPDLPEVQLPSRHLGLLTAEEVADLDEKIALLGKTAQETIALDALSELAATAVPLPFSPQPVPPAKKFRLGIAKDAAFCFYYAENLQMLEQCGAELIPVSPLTDADLPPELDGLYFGGGYPELYLPQLSGNLSFHNSLQAAAEKGMPIFAECGGFLYLQQSLTNLAGNAYPWAVILSGHATIGTRLCRFGYLTLTAAQNTMMGKKRNAGKSTRISLCR
jgi:cobyrinic acid a,c-diamide synthase